MVLQDSKSKQKWLHVNQSSINIFPVQGYCKQLMLEQIFVQDNTYPPHIIPTAVTNMKLDLKGIFLKQISLAGSKLYQIPSFYTILWRCSGLPIIYRLVNKLCQQQNSTRRWKRPAGVVYWYQLRHRQRAVWLGVREQSQPALTTNFTYSQITFHISSGYCAVGKLLYLKLTSY